MKREESLPLYYYYNTKLTFCNYYLLLPATEPAHDLIVCQAPLLVVNK